MRRWAVALLLLALGAPALAPAAAAADRDQWVQTIREAHDALAQAQARHEDALADYRQMRHRRKLRGEKKETVLQEREEARTALEEAERKLEEVLESARRAGVPPGWVREAMEPADQAP